MIRQSNSSKRIDFWHGVLTRTKHHASFRFMSRLSVETQSFRRWFSAVVAAAAVLAGSLVPVAASAESRARGAMDQVAAMQPGWNLGNTLDSTGADETSWGNPRITEALLDNVKAQGFKSIRIPVTWGQHQGAAPGYAIEAAYLNRVKEVVGWALADGFQVMINIHHDS